MKKYHISSKGTVEICRAKVKPCPLGGGHYDTQEEAYQYIEEKYKTIEEYEMNISTNQNYKTINANKRGNFVDRETNQAAKDGKRTIDLYYDKNKKEWTKERQVIHREIIDSFLDKYKNVPCEGKVTFSAGLPGAGKTTVLTQYENVNMDSWATISSDDIKEILAEKGHVPEIEGLTPMESSTLVHHESSYIADELMKTLGNKKKNIVYDFTCKDAYKTKGRINALNKVGYKTEDMQFVFVDISPEVAKERAKYRYMKGLNEGLQNERDIKENKSTKKTIGGRYLPEEIINSCKPEGDKYSSINAETLVSIHEELNLPPPKTYDNSGSSPIQVPYNEFTKKSDNNKLPSLSDI